MLQYNKTVNINQKLLPCWAGSSQLALLVFLEKALVCLVNSSVLGSAGASAHPSGTRHGAAQHLRSHELCKHRAACTDDEDRFWQGCSTGQLLCAHVGTGECCSSHRLGDLQVHGRPGYKRNSCQFTLEQYSTCEF